MSNTNCLEGFQCPKCKSFEPFKIKITVTMEVYDEGVGEQVGDNEWDDDSYCQCGECGLEGTVKTFSED